MVLDLISRRREEQVLRAICLGLSGYYAAKAPAATRSGRRGSGPRSRRKASRTRYPA